MLFLSVLCLCLCALTLRTQGRGGDTDCVCGDAWLNRKGERASGRVLCRKHVSVWSAEVLWMTHLRWLSLYLSSFFFAPPTYPSCVPTNKVSLCLSYLRTSFNKRWCVWWKVCQRCWLKWFMWRWTLLSFVIGCSHRPEGYFSAERQGSYNSPGGVNAVIARSCDISFFSDGRALQFLRFHGVTGTLNKLLFSKTKARVPRASYLALLVSHWEGVVSGDVLPLRSLNS